MFWKTYFVSLIFYILADLIWLGVIARNFYVKQIGFLMKSNLNWLAAGLFYFILIFGLVYFVINPALNRNSWFYAFMTGAIFGGVVYATYNLTNLSTLKDWPILLTFVDIAWGSFAGAFVSFTVYLIVKWLF